MQGAEPTVITLCDDPAMRVVLRFLLSDIGCKIVDIEEADAITSAAPLNGDTAPLLIVVAGRGEDGVQVIGALHQAGYRFPVALLARLLDSTMRKRAFALGARDVIGLPVAIKDLHARLRVLVDEHTWQVERDQKAVETIRAGG